MPWTKLTSLLSSPTREDLKKTSEQLKEIAKDLKETSVRLAAEVEELRKKPEKG